MLGSYRTQWYWGDFNLGTSPFDMHVAVVELRRMAGCCKRKIHNVFARCELNQTVQRDFGIEYYVLFVPVRTTVGLLPPAFELRAKFFSPRVFVVPHITVVGLLFPSPSGTRWRCCRAHTCTPGSRS